jgi:pSer/pThr/pTyr-binding forkhead associated (FHA) protein
MAKLIVVQGSQEQALTLPDGVHVIGRSSRCSVYIQDVAASREHCKLMVQGAGLKLVDEGSRNGTLVNGRRAGTEELKAGDVIRIGDTLIHVEFKRGDRRVEASDPVAASSPVGSGTTLRARAVIKDYSVWSAGAMPRIARTVRQVVNYALLIALVGVLAAIGYAVGRRGGGGRSVVVANKIQRNAAFSADPAGSWAAADDSARVSWDRATGRAAPGSLLIEKTRPAAAATIEYQVDIPVSSRRRLDGEVWARSEGYRGAACLVVGWRDRSQRAIAFDVSPFVELKEDWSLLRGDFQPPSAATSARIGVALWGGTGRVFLDDIEVLNEAGLETASHHVLGDYSTYSARRSLSQVLWWKSLLLAMNVRLEFVGKEGGILSMGCEPVKIRREGMDRVELAGSVVWPVGGQPVPLTQTLSFENGELVSTVHLTVPAGRQVDEIHLLMDLPKADRISIPEGGIARGVTIQLGNHEFEISYGEPVKIGRSDERGVTLLRQEYAVQGESIVFGWSVRETSTTAEVMVRKLKEDLQRVGDDRLGLRRSILTRLKDRLRDLEEIQSVTRKIDDIGRVEASDWAKVQIEARIALMSGRPERAEMALKQVQAFLDRFEDTGLSDAVQQVSGELTVLLAGVQADEQELGRRFLEMAQKHIQSGKDDLARGILSVVAGRWGADEIGQEARRLLESLKK